MRHLEKDDGIKVAPQPVDQIEQVLNQFNAFLAQMWFFPGLFLTDFAKRKH
jgi:hypothetical protein